jgi:hypothetical protein
MGGAGAKPDASDLTISVDTRILLEFENTVNVDEYKLTNTTEYTFIRPPKNGRFAIFAISTPELKESIVLSCDLPLFDYWYFFSAEQMQRSIATLLDSVKLSVVYEDSAGNRHTSTKNVRLSEVPESEWSDYLAIFRNIVGPLRKRRPEEYRDSMKIFYCDLRSAVANEQYSLDEINGLKLVYSTLQNKSDSYCFWTAAYPSLVKRVEFKADAFSPDDSERHWEFRIVPFSPSGSEYRNEWLRHHELRPLELNTWMLPGHGIVLMWRDRHSSAAVGGATSTSGASIQSRKVAAGGSGDSDAS